MSSAKLIDPHGRHLTYLRLSITDRCNLRCSYCIPQQNFKYLSPEEILTYEELLRICSLFAQMGLKKIRCTGGEPLVRHGVDFFIEQLSHLKNIQEVCLTTNGVLLNEYAKKLWDAGVRHVNVSLDTLKPSRFASITGRPYFEKVWSGLMALVDMGFEKVKINAVITRGVNDDEIVDIASLAAQYPIEVRFIEFMPVGNNKWNNQMMVSVPEMQAIIEKALGKLEPVESEEHAGPAKLFSFKGAKGKLGFISPLSHHFCASCNRIRLTADGRLRLCLFSDVEYDIKSIIRNGANDKELKSFLLDCIRRKPESYHKENDTGSPSCTRAMGTIGG